MRTLAIFLMILVTCGWPAAVLAQGQLPEPQMSAPGTPAPPPPGLVVPIDTGIFFLVLSGFILGGYTLVKFPRKA